jgi:hypothetical protein
MTNGGGAVTNGGVMAEVVLDVPSWDQPANRPKYLGSPTVVLMLIHEIVASAFDHVEGKSNFNGAWNTVREISHEITGGADYVRMPGWHTPECLGQALLDAFGIIPEPTLEHDLGYCISEALMTVYLKVRELLTGFAADPGASWGLHLLPQINRLQGWAVAVFLGKNDRFYPGLRIEDFVWEAAASSVY